MREKTNIAMFSHKTPKVAHTCNTKIGDKLWNIVTTAKKHSKTAFYCIVLTAERKCAKIALRQRKISARTVIQLSTILFSLKTQKAGGADFLHRPLKITG